MNNTENEMARIAELTAANVKKIAILGARAMVWGKFFDAALPHLTTLQRIEVTQSFRERIEDALSMTDDVPLPAEYQSTLLELTNDILLALGQKSGGRP